MKFFKQLKKLREEDRVATRNSQALLEELDRTESTIDKQHEEALTRLNESKKQARKLKDADARNHYSEGLAQSFRGEAIV